MANEHNLENHKFNKRTASEQREIASKGGKASGKARRQKADLRKAMSTILSLEVDGTNRAILKSLGVEPTNEMMLAFVTLQQAFKGNQRAVENVIKLTSIKDKHDIDEQKARTKLLKTQNKEREQALSGENTVEMKLAEYFEKLNEVRKHDN